MKRHVLTLVLVVFLMFFICIPYVVADPSFPQSLKGQYRGSGTTTCIAALCGFDKDMVPNVPAGPNGGWGSGAWSVSVNNHLVTINFDFDGTGTYSETHRSTVLNNSGPKVPWPSLTGETKFSHKLNYTIRSDGTVVVKDVPGTFKVELTAGPPFMAQGFSLAGNISSDGSMMFLADTGVPHTFLPPLYACPVPMEPKVEMGMSCTGTFTLFKQSQ
jgi:hypothetical protein